ncbi:MAG: primosomal protein N' [Rhodospirillales bacterium]|nr:primosomal protein N' [Rhodospirillales bacterium]MCB9995079.1 primosomal protein N' [Rhodospirillales bacterium]
MQSLFQGIESDQGEESADNAGLMSVLVPYPVDKAYTYGVPAGLGLVPGDYVSVPLGNREVPGVVWGDAVDNVPAEKLKSVIAKYDLPPMPEVTRRFLDWVAHYNMAPRGFVMKMALSVPGALETPKPVTGYKITDWALTALSSDDNSAFLQQHTPQRRRILALLRDRIPRRAAEIADQAACSAAVVKGMLAHNLVETVDIHATAPCRNPVPDKKAVTLSEAQQAAADTMAGYVRDGGYHTALLDGVTGAGKTEVYFEAVAAALEQDKQVLILLPEIALSNAFLDRFRARFGCKPALWHSGLSAGQRKMTWRGVAMGQTKVVVGARSALFLPYQDLGLIIVDEEHDPAYKQEDGVIYHARDMAVVRAHMGKIPLVLVSATPSLETMANVWAGKYDLLHLPDRHGAARLPDMHIIDMKADKPERQHFISPPLKEALAENLEAGEQSLLFLNRRGYAPLTLCRTCGHRMNCPRCTAWLVEHKKAGRLSCHHCGYFTNMPKACPECGDHESFAACGPGVERIHEEVKKYFPEARTVVLASDTAEDHDSLKALLTDIRDHKYDIIIGTQIIAKGHHFPRLTLVGVVDADLGLAGGDLRAAERTYQLLHQVAGRAGREELPGRVYLQTFLPGNKVMQALAGHGRDLFLDVEAAEREAAHMPPYTRLAGIIVSGKDEQLVMETARELGKVAPQLRGEQGSIVTLGPAEAPFYRLRGNYRRRLLVRADKNLNLQQAISGWLAQVKIPSTIRVYVDIDPQSFL